MGIDSLLFMEFMNMNTQPTLNQYRVRVQGGVGVKFMMKFIIKKKVT